MILKKHKSSNSEQYGIVNQLNKRFHFQRVIYVGHTISVSLSGLDVCSGSLFSVALSGQEIVCHCTSSADLLSC